MLTMAYLREKALLKVSNKAIGKKKNGKKLVKMTKHSGFPHSHDSTNKEVMERFVQPYRRPAVAVFPITGE